MIAPEKQVLENMSELFSDLRQDIRKSKRDIILAYAICCVVQIAVYFAVINYLFT